MGSAGTPTSTSLFGHFFPTSFSAPRHTPRRVVDCTWRPCVVDAAFILCLSSSFSSLHSNVLTNSRLLLTNSRLQVHGLRQVRQGALGTVLPLRRPRQGSGSGRQGFQGVGRGQVSAEEPTRDLQTTNDKTTNNVSPAPHVLSSLPSPYVPRHTTHLLPNQLYVQRSLPVPVGARREASPARLSRWRSGSQTRWRKKKAKKAEIGVGVPSMGSTKHVWETSMGTGSGQLTAARICPPAHAVISPPARPRPIPSRSSMVPGDNVVADDARAFAITRTQQHQTTPSRNTPP